MRELTDKEKRFLIVNEDKMTIEQFANLFGITCEELYQHYDNLTNSPMYRNHTLQKIDNYKQKRGF